MGLDQDDAGPVPARKHRTGHWWLPAALLVPGALAELGGEASRELLRYGRESLAQGEWWRLLSGHIVHLGWSHFLLNAIALLLIWALFGHYLRPLQWLVLILLAVLLIDAGFWFLDPELYWYVGLSGLLHAMLAGGVVAGARTAPLEMSLFGALLVVKVGYEQLYGALPGSAAAAGGPVAINAHLFGALAGGAVACWIVLRRPRTTSL